MGACYPEARRARGSTKSLRRTLLNDANGRRTLGWQNDDGDTALHLACFGAPAAALVLAKAGAPRDVLNNRSETPDDLARRAGLRLDPGVCRYARACAGSVWKSNFSLPLQPAKRHCPFIESARRRPRPRLAAPGAGTRRPAPRPKPCRV